MQAYSQELQANRLIDHADLLRMATTLLNRGPVPAVLLLEPAGLETCFLERELLRAFPESERRILPVDEPASAGQSAASDLELLRWLKNPTEAPPRIGDGTVRIRAAVGEINEIRDVLRGCVATEVPLDDVELLHTDSQTYLPLVYETFCTLAREGETLGDDLPVTFAEGVPCRYSRPGRALALWLAWIADDYPQRTLVQMLREGLLDVSTSGDEDVSFGRLSGLLRGLGVGFGRARYQTQLRDRMEGLQRQIEAPQGGADEDGEPEPDRLKRLQHQLRTFEVLESLCTKLLACAPTDRSNQLELLTGAMEFLQTLARSVNQIDRFAVLKLVSEIREILQCLAPGDGEIGFDAWEWLARLPTESRVLGSGPRPGCLHVAHVQSGGHSGRAHTVIVGLDDSRFPGAGLQDPVLLDSERRQVSPQLVTAAARLEQRLGDFSRLLARLRGTVTLSFCTQSVDDDREMFASGPVLSAYRLISGERKGDPSDLAAWLIT